MGAYPCEDLRSPSGAILYRGCAAVKLKPPETQLPGQGVRACIGNDDCGFGRSIFGGVDLGGRLAAPAAAPHTLCAVLCRIRPPPPGLFALPVRAAHERVTPVSGCRSGIGSGLYAQLHAISAGHEQYPVGLTGCVAQDPAVSGGTGNAPSRCCLCDRPKVGGEFFRITRHNIDLRICW